MDRDRLSHIFDSIDGALDDDDLLTSDDAMRWSPAEAAVPDDTAPGERAPVGLDSYYQERHERALGVHTTAGLNSYYDERDAAAVNRLRSLTGPPGALRGSQWAQDEERARQLADRTILRASASWVVPGAAAMYIQPDAPEPRRTGDRPVTAAGGWCAPLESLYDLPDPFPDLTLLSAPPTTRRWTNESTALTEQDMQRLTDAVARFGAALRHGVQALAEYLTGIGRELARHGLTPQPTPTDRAQAVIEARRHRNTGPTTRRRLDGRNQRHHQPPQTHTTRPRRPQHTHRNP